MLDIKWSNHNISLSSNLKKVLLSIEYYLASGVANSYNSTIRFLRTHIKYY